MPQGDFHQGCPCEHCQGFGGSGVSLPEDTVHDLFRSKPRKVEREHPHTERRSPGSTFFIIAAGLIGGMTGAWIAWYFQ